MKLARWITPLLLVVGLFTLAWPARGDAESKVDDGAHFFKPETIASADDSVKQLKADTGVEIVVETFEGIPEKAQVRWEAAKDDPQKRKEFYDQWIESRGRALKLHGVYVLIVKDPGHLAVEAGKVTREKAMPQADQDKMASLLLDEFKQKNYDQGLQKALDFARDTIKQNLNGQKLEGSQAASSNAVPAVGPVPGPGNDGGVNNSGNVPFNSPGLGNSGPHFFGACMWFVVIAIGVIFVFNLVRRGLGDGGFGGGGLGANQGYGPQGGPGYGYGPQRSGFMSGLFGGLLGGAAGSYLENRVENREQGGGFTSNTGGTTSQGDFGNSGGESFSGGSSQGDFGPPSTGPSGGDFGSSGGDFGGGGGGGDSGGGGGSGGDF